MSGPWNAAPYVPATPTGVAGWVRIIGRGVPLVAVIVTCLPLMMMVRMVERPLTGDRRPVSGLFPMMVSRVALALIGIRYRVVGRPMTGPGAIVANHSSWLDIFALNAGMRLSFVAKSEVAGWAGIGPLARASGTVFIRRDRAAATDQIGTLTDQLTAGQPLLIFPEGTSTDGRHLVPFKPTLFAAFLGGLQRDRMQVQPVSVIWKGPAGGDPRVYGWWGDMDFGPHLLAVLALPRQGAVTVQYHPPVQVADHPDRKALARVTHAMVAAGLRDAGVLAP